MASLAVALPIVKYPSVAFGGMKPDGGADNLKSQVDAVTSVVPDIVSVDDNTARQQKEKIFGLLL